MSEQLASEISARIKNLESLFEDPLRYEMDELKKALQENPSAASLLLDEDIGLLVRNLRRLVSVAVAEANAPKEKKASTKKAAAIKRTPDLLMQAKDEGFPE